MSSRTTFRDPTTAPPPRNSPPMCYHPTEHIMAEKAVPCTRYLQALHRRKRARGLCPCGLDSPTSAGADSARLVLSGPLYFPLRRAFTCLQPNPLHLVGPSPATTTGRGFLQKTPPAACTFRRRRVPPRPGRGRHAPRSHTPRPSLAPGPFPRGLITHFYAPPPRAIAAPGGSYTRSRIFTLLTLFGDHLRAARLPCARLQCGDRPRIRRRRPSSNGVTTSTPRAQRRR